MAKKRALAHRKSRQRDHQPVVNSAAEAPANSPAHATDPAEGLKAQWPSKKGATKAELKRRSMRERLWTDAAEITWSRHDEKGFTTIPRTVPLIASMLKQVTLKGDPSRVYLDLWGRAFDEGFVEVFDESELALACGYPAGRRQVRTWQERLKLLEELGFVRVKSKPSRAFGYILLVHPHDAVLRLRRDRPGLIPEKWWELFLSRIHEIGARLRDVPTEQLPNKSKLALTES